MAIKKLFVDFVLMFELYCCGTSIMTHVSVDLVHPDSCELRPFMWNHQVTRITKASMTSLPVVDIQCPIQGGYHVR